MAEEVHTAAMRPNGGEGGYRRDQVTAPPARAAEHAAIDEQRWEILQRLECWLETPMVVLGVVWLALLVAGLVWGLSPLLRDIANLIWIIFGVDFAISFLLA